jgi:hypothetical protein
MTFKITLCNYDLDQWVAYICLSQWLQTHCATSRKFADSIPNGVIGIFIWHNISCRTMALEVIQPLTEISTRNTFWGVKRPVCRADNITTFMCRLSWNLGASTSWNSMGLSRAVMGLLYSDYRLTVLQARRPWVQFPMVSLEFFIAIILLATLWP